jgi:hypothetical protein
MSVVESKLMFQRNALSPSARLNKARPETSLNFEVQEINLFILDFFNKQETYLVNVVSNWFFKTPSTITKFQYINSL